MALVDILPAGSALEGVLAHRPELLTRYRTFFQSFWQDELVPRRVLALCRLRIAFIHDCEAEAAVDDPHVVLSEAERDALRTGTFEDFDAAEQAALQLAEYMPFAVHGIADEWAQAADAHFGHSGCVALLTAIAFFDVSCRMKKVLDLPVEQQALSAEHLT